jgi:putative ABC transport system substrate-binding protein
VIPIVATVVVDPVGSGRVASLAHPGGNVTGLSVVSPEMVAKRLELLLENVDLINHAARLLAVLGAAHTRC